MASAALEDFARKPTGYKAGVFTAIFLAIVGLYYQFGFKPLDDKLTGARASSQQMAAKKAQMEKDEVAFRELQTKMVKLRRIIDENQKALPTGAELPAFFDTLNRKVNEAGVEIRKWEYKSDVPVAAFVKVPVELELTGTFFELKRFFASLIQQRGVRAEGAAAGGEQDRERIVTIENLQLTNPQVKDREIHLTAKFTASTFRQEEVDESAAGGKAGASGGLRGKAEDAARKQDERTRKGSGMDDQGPTVAPKPAGKAGALEGGL